MSQMAAATAQMAALAVVPPPAQNTHAYAPREQVYVPPIQQVAVPMQQPFSAVGAYPAGRGGQHGGRGRNQGGCRGGRSRMPFVDAMQGAGAAPMMTPMIPYGGGIACPPPEWDSGANNRISLTSIKYTTIGMHASVVVLTSKTGTRPSRAPSNGGTTRICWKRTTVCCGGIRSVHKRYAQGGLTGWEEHPTVRGEELWFSKLM
jgi:hypothetical protein